MAGQLLGDGGSDVADVERDEQPLERALRPGADAVDELVDAAVLPPGQLRGSRRADPGRRNTSARSFSQPCSRNWVTVFSPRPSMSRAPREARWMSDCAMRLGQSTFSQKWWPSPSGRTSGWPHAGHAAGIFHALAPFGRLSLTLPTTSGITSPARRTMTVSPTRTSLASTWISLWSVALVIVTPGDRHRLEHRERRGLAGAADVHLDGAEDRLLLDRRHLVGDRPAGRLGGGAERAPLRHVVDLDHDAVDLEPEVVAARGEVLDERPHVVDGVDRGRRVGHRQARGARPVEELGVGARTRGPRRGRGRGSTSPAGARAPCRGPSGAAHPTPRCVGS